MKYLSSPDFENAFVVGENEDIEILHYFLYMAHIIQLVLKELLGKMKINLTNEKFQKIWNNEKKNAQLYTRDKNLLLILVKIQNCNHYFNHLFIDQI